jgi:hypothetical protein
MQANLFEDETAFDLFLDSDLVSHLAFCSLVTHCKSKAQIRPNIKESEKNLSTNYGKTMLL